MEYRLRPFQVSVPNTGSVSRVHCLAILFSFPWPAPEDVTILRCVVKCATCVALYDKACHESLRSQTIPEG